MKPVLHSLHRLSLGLQLAAVLSAGLIAGHAAVQTQTLTLDPGWNAVWIEPSPEDASLEEVFADDSITVVARPLLPAGSAEFVTESTSVFNQEEWLVWYRNPKSLVNTLDTLTGNQAYYIKVEAPKGSATPISVNITGEVTYFRPDWVPASYNLIGFNLSTSVSFASFFGAAGESDGNHPIDSILRLDSSTGDWTGVLPTDLMEPGEAYWIKSVRHSSFMGPVAITFGGLGSLAFGDGPGETQLGDDTDPTLVTLREVTFSNVDDTAHPASLVLVEPADNDALRVFEVVPGPEALTHAIGPAGQFTTLDLGDLAARTSRTVTLGAERNWTTGDPVRESLYRLDIGAQYIWLPVTARNSNVLPGEPGEGDPAYAGLWVGEVILDSVSDVKGGSPSPTSTTAPMRILIHVDDTGAASLLSHVTVMQTKTADESVPAEEVLVLDEAKIPFFEGIETRGGKRVGRRIESVTYDIPRDYSPTVQTALLEEVAAASEEIPDADSVTAEDIELYLNAQTERPPDLAEAYRLSWPLEGGLGPDAVVQTSSEAPLSLDPFHRSNPFRHAFHPRHGAGYAITRHVTVTFDGTDLPEQLRGRYEENIGGLAAASLTVRGTITLARISKVTQTE